MNQQQVDWAYLWESVWGVATIAWTAQRQRHCWKAHPSLGADSWKLSSQSTLEQCAGRTLAGQSCLLTRRERPWKSHEYQGLLRLESIIHSPFRTSWVLDRQHGSTPRDKMLVARPHDLILSPNQCGGRRENCPLKLSSDLHTRCGLCVSTQ